MSEKVENDAVTKAKPNKTGVYAVLAVVCGICVFGFGYYLVYLEDLNWYDRLIKPVFMPPIRVLGYAWLGMCVLYITSALFVILKPAQPASQTGKQKSQALWSIAANALLSLVWIYIFFIRHMPGSALFELVLVWVSCYVMLLSVYVCNKWSAWLQIPNLIWLTFMAILNYFLVMLN